MSKYQEECDSTIAELRELTAKMEPHKYTDDDLRVISSHILVWSNLVYGQSEGDKPYQYNFAMLEFAVMEYAMKCGIIMNFVHGDDEYDMQTSLDVETLEHVDVSKYM